MMALPATLTAQLVIPATTGAEACLEGNSVWSELARNNQYALTIESPPTQNTAAIGTPLIRISGIRVAVGNSNLAEASVSLALQESGINTPLQAADLGTVSQSDLTVFISASTHTFNNLKKNTRYVAILYTRTSNNLISAIIARKCFKTRGEFTNAEQNLKPDGSAHLTKFGSTGCFAVASTRQDIADCMCNGTRGGTLILAGQTTGSQAARQHWGCPDLDS